MEIVKLDGVNKTYRSGADSLTILQDVNLTVEDGCITVISGESGSGKTTLLNLIGGLDCCSSGTIYSCGYAIHTMNEKKLSKYRNIKIGFIFQFHFLLKDFTALENIMLPALMAGAYKKEAIQKAENLIREVGCENRASHYPSELSGGERQRIAVARALINDPQLILADEPTGNLDEANSQKVEDLLFGLVRKYRKTLLLVTHEKRFFDKGDIRCHLEHGSIVMP